MNSNISQPPDGKVKQYSEQPGPLRTKQLSDLAILLADILTVPNDEARDLLNQCPADAQGLYETLIYAPNMSTAVGGLLESVSKKWRGQTMMLLPEAWVARQDGSSPEALLIEVGDLDKRASLRHVTLEKISFGDKHDPTSDRVALLRKLREQLPKSQQDRYSSFLTLIDESDLPYSKWRTATYPHGNDLQLLVATEWLENRFEDERQDAERRSRGGTSHTDATRPAVRRTLGKAASARVLEKLHQYIEQTPTSSEAEHAPGALILRVLCNTVVNRQLLERAHQHGLTTIAQDANVRFLKATAFAGIQELDIFELSGRSAAWFPLFRNPEDVTQLVDWPIADYVKSLDGKGLMQCTEDGLQALFGPASRWATVGNPPLVGHDQRWVMRLSKVVFNHYLQTRGRGACGRYIHWAMAVMAVMACWFSVTASVPHLVAASNRRLSSFPGKNAPDNWRPTAAHLALYSVMTGQLIFGNSGLGLNAAAVDEYIKSNESVHAAVQGVLFHVFKRLPLCSLLEFFEKTGAHTDAPDKSEWWSLA